MVNEIITYHQKQFLKNNPNKTICKKEIRRFWTFVAERQNIWHKRYELKSKEPYTTDKVLINTKFTNVYRQLDRGTIYYLEHIIPKCTKKYSKSKTLLFNTVIYRLFNNVPTAEIIGIQSVKNFKPKKLLKKLEEMEKRGQRIFTNAHMVTGGGSQFKGFKKHETALYAINEFHKIFDNIYENICKADHMEEVFHLLKNNIIMIGPFLAYEIVIDLCYSSFLPFTEDDWVNIGPGAGRGMDIIFPNRKLMPAKDIIPYLRKTQKNYFNKYNLNFKFLHQNDKKIDMTLRNIEHSLCEFQKYFKCIHETGKSRMKFVKHEKSDELLYSYINLGFIKKNK